VKHTFFNFNPSGANMPMYIATKICLFAMTVETHTEKIIKNKERA